MQLQGHVSGEPRSQTMMSEEQQRTAAADAARVEAEQRLAATAAELVGVREQLDRALAELANRPAALDPVVVKNQDGSSYPLPNPDKLTNQDYVRRVLDQVKIGLSLLVAFACRTHPGLGTPAPAHGSTRQKPHDVKYLLKHIQAHPAEYATVLGVSEWQMTCWVQECITDGLLKLRHEVAHQQKPRYTYHVVEESIDWAESLCQAVVARRHGAGLLVDAKTGTAAGAAVHNLAGLRRQYAAKRAPEVCTSWVSFVSSSPAVLPPGCR